VYKHVTNHRVVNYKTGYGVEPPVEPAAAGDGREMSACDGSSLPLFFARHVTAKFIRIECNCALVLAERVKDRMI
jgi:hypothetical protein